MRKGDVSRYREEYFGQNRLPKDVMYLKLQSDDNIEKEADILDPMTNTPIPPGHEKVIKEDGIEYTPSGALLRGAEDSKNAYWDSFLPIFFDRLSLITRRVMAGCVKEYGLTGVHATYLVAINLREGLTMTELSSFLDIDTANTNRVIKALTEKGLVYDDRPTPRSKKFSIFLTDEGKRVANNIMAKTQETMNGFFKGIPQFSIDNMKYTLIKMLYNVDPGFEAYVDSKWVNPFFTYLSLGWDEEDPNALKFGREEYVPDSRKTKDDE